ncbi:MAG: hypothetical protein AAF616_05210 [Bacteroidota bacterium]
MEANKPPKKKRKAPHRGLIGGITIALIVLSIIGIIALLGKGYGAFTIVGFLILMLWTNVFLGYFIWATYFYNLGYGVSTQVWAKIEQAKDDKANGEPYNADILDEEPLYNPYKDQTFGLPPGTVRGMIAFTLLFGGVALLLASFDIQGELPAEQLFRDPYDFFKTAFLMMVAFYFGTKSLKYITGNDKTLSPYNTAMAQSKGKPLADDNLTDKNAPGNEKSQVEDREPEHESTAQTKVVVIDGADPLGEKNLEPGTKPTIKGIDPMSSPKDQKDES